MKNQPVMHVKPIAGPTRQDTLNAGVSRAPVVWSQVPAGWTAYGIDFNKLYRQNEDERSKRDSEG